MQLLLRGGIIVTEKECKKADLLINGEKIGLIQEHISDDLLSPHCQVIELDGKMVFPGIIDAHTHYQLSSRGTVTADDFHSGSISAACGGVTTFIDYADHRLDISLKESGEDRINQALGQTVIDFTLHQTITDFNEQISEELAELSELGINSVKIFTTYRREGYMISPDKWSILLKRLKELELLLTVHAEDDEMIYLLEEEYRQKGLLSPEMHPLIRPSESEGKAVEQIGRLGMEANIPVYIVHLSSKAGLEALQKIRGEGGKIYAETTPHYLLLSHKRLLEPQAQRYIMTPPLREEIDQKALWEGLKGGEIQLVATDHCSFTLEQKLRNDNCLTILPGIPGTETLLPVIHHFGVRGGVIDYPQLVEILSTNPAKIFGLYPEKGSLHLGTDADLVIFDPEVKVTLDQTSLHSKAGYSPYEGLTVQGYPIMTILRGEIIAKDGEYCGLGIGKYLNGKRSSLYDE